MYSTTENDPTVLPINSYTTTYQDFGNYVIFDTTRSMTASGNDTYDIPLDTTFSMVWAFNKPAINVVYHDDNRGQFYVTLSSTGSCTLGIARYPKATLHGVLMWFAWSVLAILQLVTARYTPEYWKNRYKMHAIVGGLIGIVTLASTIIVLKWLGWAFYFDFWHNVAGILFMVLC